MAPPASTAEPRPPTTLSARSCARRAAGPHPCVGLRVGLLLVTGAGALAGCANLKRDAYPGSFHAAMLNDRREDLFVRPRGLDTPSSYADLEGAATVPPRPASEGKALRLAPAGVATLVPPPAAEPRVPSWEPPRRTPGKRPGRERGSLAVAAPPVADLSVVPPLPSDEPRHRVAPELWARWLRHGENPTLRRQRIASFAASLVGARKIVANGRRYAANCSDFVRAVYSIEGVDLYHWPSRPRGFGGVRSLYGLSQQSGGLHFRKIPEVGDLVFFHHTYDSNKNNQIDDFLSHVGVVEKLDGDGTVTYVDRSGGRVRRGQLNLHRPNLWRDPHSLKRLNSYLRGRKKTDPAGTRYLAGDLFAGFGTLLR